MFQLGSYVFFDGTCADAMPQPYEGMKNFSLSLSYPTAQEAHHTVDRFGTPWMVNGGATRSLA
nr:hypothetical protein [Rhodoferax sp.]